MESYPRWWPNACLNPMGSTDFFFKSTPPGPVPRFQKILGAIFQYIFSNTFCDSGPFLAPAVQLLMSDCLNMGPLEQKLTMMMPLPQSTSSCLKGQKFWRSRFDCCKAKELSFKTSPFLVKVEAQGPHDLFKHNPARQAPF